MGVWEVISGLQTLNHNLPMDAAAILIRDLKSKIDGKIEDERAKARQDLLMPYLRLTPKDIIIAFNTESSGILLDIPEPLFTGPSFTNQERNRYAAWRNITHAIPWAPACDVDPLTTFNPLIWQTWHWLDRQEFAYASNIHGLPKQLMATRGPIFDYCDQTAYGMVAYRGQYTATSTNDEVRALARSYNVLVEQQNSNVTMLSDHKAATAVDKTLNDQCLLFFTTTFAPPILASIKSELLREEWAAAYTSIVNRYSVNQPNETLPTRDIEAAINQLKHDPYKYKVAETFVVLDSMLVLLHLSHYINKPTSPRPGPNIARIKHNLRLSLPMTDAAFALAHPGVTRFVEAREMRDMLLGVFRGVDHYKHKVDSWTYTKKTVAFAEIREGLSAEETVPLKPRQPTPFAASVTEVFDPMDPSSSTSSDHAAFYTQHAPTKSSPIQLATQIPCVICLSNTLRHANGTTHDAARCRTAKTFLDMPALAHQKGFTRSLANLGLPSAAELVKLGDTLGPMRRDNSRPLPPPTPSDTNKRPISPSAQNSQPNQRNRFNPQTGSRQNSRRASPASSRPSSPSNRPRSPGGSLPPRPSSPSNSHANQNSFVQGLQNPTFVEMLRSAIEKTVEKAMADRK